MNLRLFPKIPPFRRCRRRRLRPPQCLRWWQKWQSRARWHHGKPAAVPPAGEEQHWLRSWRASDPCCSRRLETSPWKRPSSRGSENEEWRGQGWIMKLLCHRQMWNMWWQNLTFTHRRVLPLWFNPDYSPELQHTDLN